MKSHNSLNDILADAEAKGFNQEERHLVAEVYRAASKEYGWAPQHNLAELFKHNDEKRAHAANAARTYMHRKIDEWQKEKPTSDATGTP